MKENYADEEKDAAFAKLFRVFYPVLYARALRWSGSPQLAKDVVQDVFVALWERGKDWQQLDNPEAYLTASVRNRLAKVLKREGRRLPPEALPTSGAEYANLLLAQAAEERSEQLRRALAELSPAEREMLAAKYFDGKTYDDLARTTGKKKQTIYNQVFRAVEKLRKVLGFFL